MSHLFIIMIMFSCVSALVQSKRGLSQFLHKVAVKSVLSISTGTLLACNLFISFSLVFVFFQFQFIQSGRQNKIYISLIMLATKSDTKITITKQTKGGQNKDDMLERLQKK